MLYTIVKNAALPSSLTSCPRDIEQIRHDQYQDQYTGDYVITLIMLPGVATTRDWRFL